MSLGPYYNYADELKYPSEIPIERNGDVIRGPSAIVKNAAGIQYYVNAMGTGTSTGFVANYSDMAQAPMGLNYFFNTGQQCSNGAPMYQYMTTIPTGISGSIGEKLKKTLGGNLQGLAPGVLQDAFEAMNPVPIFKAVIGTGFAKCKLEEAPVGNANGELQSRWGKPARYGEEMVPNIWVDAEKEKVYYKDLPPGDGSKYVPSGKQPFARRWVFDKWISQDEYEWTQAQLKTMGRFYPSDYIPDQNTPPDPDIPAKPSENERNYLLQQMGTDAEGFTSRNQKILNFQQVGGGLLLAGLALGLVAFTALRK